jgi:hypothetical protein
MKSLIKELRNRRSYTRSNKSVLKTTLLSVSLLAFIGLLLALSGNMAGIAAGTLLAAAPFAFTLPEGVEFSENEKKGLLALANHFTEQFNKYDRGILTEAEVLKKMEEKLKEWGKENGIDREKLQQMTETLKTQGEALREMKENPARKGNVSGLKKEFLDRYEQLKEAIEKKTVNFEIKANPDASDNALIESRPNIITTTSGANLIEQEGHDPELYLKRRDRQYIHDIADVSHVAQVPETFSFDEEGDESGNIAVVTENGLKPQVQLKLIRNKVESKKVAGYIVVTEETMKWRTRVWTSIQRLFRDKVYRDFENALTADLLTNATQYISTPLDGTMDSPTDLDAIVAAICQLEQLNFQPDTLILNPSDKWKIALSRTTDGAFIFPYIAQGGQFKILFLNVITTNRVAPGEFIAGESGIWKIEEEPPRLRTALVNDDAIHNRMTIIGEIFYLSYVPSNNAGGFIHASFADVKEALIAGAPEA